MDTERCDWCGQEFSADDAFFDSLADPATRQLRLVTACSQEHLQALATGPEQRRRRRLGRWRRARRRAA